MEIKIIKTLVDKEELKEIAKSYAWDAVKAVVDVEQEIMAIGGEFHADEEALLMEKEGSRRESTWGINLYPEESGENFIEFDSMVNLKPAFGNRSRNVEDALLQKKIREIVVKLVRP
ncbi:MAG: hypothetical protein HYS60_02085 [Candidatus Wildermuthbacteria bacterium]|nr:hypothetical protein [Candidatus Wildermuthbacteria bacterium]